MSTNVAEVHAAYRSASYHSPNPRPLWQRLFADAWLAWGASRAEQSARLRVLLTKLGAHKGEITPEEDAAFRRIYRLEAAK